MMKFDVNIYTFILRQTCFIRLGCVDNLNYCFMCKNYKIGNNNFVNKWRLPKVVYDFFKYEGILI